MRSTISVLAFLLLTSCSSSPPAATTSEPAAAPVKDLSGLLPAAGRLSVSVVPNHLMGNPKLPGGTVGEYESGGKKYQIFVLEAASNQAAAFLLLDARSPLQNPEYIPYMGGYFGRDGARPVYVFAKVQYLAGVAGLSKEEADPIARIVAARLK